MSLPKAPIERIIRKAGAERVSDEAVEELRKAVGDLGKEIADEANSLAEHAGRNTVKEEDIKMVTEG